MRCLNMVLALCILAGAAHSARAELDPAEWNDLRSEWNRLFRTSPMKDPIKKIQRGDFFGVAAELSKAPNHVKAVEAYVKDLKEMKLAPLLKEKLEVLEALRNADDPKALKLLATTVKLSAADLKGLKKQEEEEKEGLERAKKSLTKTKQGYSGSAEALQAKAAQDVKLELFPPFVTHVIKVRRTALAGFTGARSHKALQWLLKKGLSDRDWEVRVGAVEALAEIESEDGVVEALEDALKDREPPVRIAALSSLVTHEAKKARKGILACLEDDEWEVRVAALEAIEALGFKDVATFDALIEAMQKEEGRLCDDFDMLLEALTGKSYYGDPSLWKDWWKANREKYEARERGEGPDPAAEPDLPRPPKAHKGPQVTASFYGIETKSHNIIFILDVSGSMNEKANLKNIPTGKGPVVTGSGHKPDSGPDPGDRPQGDTRLEVLQWQLKRSIKMLPTKATFNVIFYSDKFEVWSPEMIRATPANKRKVFDYIDQQSAAGRTNIFDALEKAFQIATSGPRMGGAGDPRYASNVGGADTFYLLSDGSPNTGRIPKPEDIIAEVRKINKLRKVVIHTVAVGGGFNRSFMERLARDNGGKCVVVE